jgi:S1-C subfamily serine protease
VGGAQRIPVVLPVAQDAENPGARKTLDAKLVGADKEINLALVKVEVPDLPVLKLAGGRPVYPGELILAVGSPEGLQGSVTMGVVNAVARQPDPSEPADFIQTYAPINAGNSGSPLIDSDCFVIGLNTMILSVACSRNQALPVTVLFGLCDERTSPLHYRFDNTRRLFANTRCVLQSSAV